MDVKQLKFYLTVAIETLQEYKEIPAGHLYAALMTQGVSLDQYNTIEGALIDIFKVEKSGFLLRWSEASQAIVDNAKAKRKQA